MPRLPSTSRRKTKKRGGKGGKTGPTLDPEQARHPRRQGLQEMALVSRMNVHGFLSKLPDGRNARRPARQSRQSRDPIIASRLPGTARRKLTADRLIKAYEFLDERTHPMPSGNSTRQRCIFPTGKALIEWQKELSLKIAPGLITQ